VKIVKIDEAGVVPALLGMGLSFGKTKPIAKYILGTNSPYYYTNQLDFSRASKLAHLGGGHSEYLKFIQTWWVIEAPDFWWDQMSQYSFVVDLSTSTMHTILQRDLTQEDFEGHIPETYIELLSLFRQQVIKGELSLDEFVGRLPRGYLYTRVVSTNYMALQNICKQRKNHKLPQWKLFIDAVREQVQHPEWVLGSEDK
jgi:hypothetical protein